MYAGANMAGRAIPVPERQRQIPPAMSELGVAVERASQLAEQLEQRLCPVLQATGQIAGGKSDSARPVAAPLVENINGLRDAMHGTCSRLQTVLDRLEI
jgi:hypothetical protein